MPTQAPKKPSAKPADQDAKENNIVAALSYVWILVFVPLFLKRDSEFAQFHAKQGLVVFIGWFVVFIFSWFVIVNVILFLTVLIFSILGFLHALNGERWVMPIFGKYAEKINL